MSKNTPPHQTQPYIPTQNPREIGTDPSGSGEFFNPQSLPHALNNHRHAPIEFNDSAEVEFGTQQYPSLLTSLFCSTIDWDLSNEDTIQPSHGFPANQIRYPEESSLPIQGAADTISYADESDATISGQNLPFVPTTSHHDEAVSQLQPYHESSYGNTDHDLHPSILEGLSDTNCNIHHYNGYYTENYPPSSLNDTPPTPPLTYADLNSNCNHSTARPKQQPPKNHRRAQDVTTLRQKRLSTTCKECGTHFKRSTDLRRHRATTIAHGSAKGPFCPVKHCKYKQRFTREDNLRAHLVRIHKVDVSEAARLIQSGRMMEAARRVQSGRMREGQDR